MRAELELVRDGTVVRVIPVLDEPIRVGRDLGNTVVLVDPEVSGHHAVIGLGAAGLQVEDLRSTNGVFVDGVRVQERASLRDGSEVRLGTAGLVFRVREVADLAPGLWVVADLVAGTLTPIEDGRLRIGSDPDCEIRLSDGPARLATLFVHDDEVRLGTEAEERPLPPGPFEVGGRSFRLERREHRRRATLREGGFRPYGYAVTARLSDAGGPYVCVSDPEGEARCEVTAEVRATFLFVLAKARVEALRAGQDELDAGWISDEDVIVGIWGRQGLLQSANRYSVLVHRVRKELEGAGLDPWFVEKRRGATRMRLDAVEVEGLL